MLFLHEDGAVRLMKTPASGLMKKYVSGGIAKAERLCYNEKKEHRHIFRGEI